MPRARYLIDTAEIDYHCRDLLSLPALFRVYLPEQPFGRRGFPVALDRQIRQARRQLRTPTGRKRRQVVEVERSRRWRRSRGTTVSWPRVSLSPPSSPQTRRAASTEGMRFTGTGLGSTVSGRFEVFPPRFAGCIFLLFLLRIHKDIYWERPESR